MAICSSYSATVLCRAAVVRQDLHLRTGIYFLGIPVPGREFRVPYGRPTGTAPRRPGPCRVFPCSARVRYDGGGCRLYSPGRWCPPDQRWASDRHLPFHSGQPCHPPRTFHRRKSRLRSMRRFTCIHPSGLPSPAVTGWNSNGFGFYPGLRTPRLPATHAKAGTVPRTLDRVMSSAMKPPDNMTTHNVRLHVAPIFRGRGGSARARGSGEGSARWWPAGTARSSGCRRRR